MVSGSYKSGDMELFLSIVRRENPSKPICVILDNARIHRAGSVKARAEELGIILIHLPPYSPDLNPIEFGWKDLKRELSKILDFERMVEKSRDIALKLFLERKAGYTKNWTEVFIGAKSY